MNYPFPIPPPTRKKTPQNKPNVYHVFAKLSLIVSTLNVKQILNLNCTQETSLRYIFLDGYPNFYDMYNGFNLIPILCKDKLTAAIYTPTTLAYHWTPVNSYVMAANTD